MLPVPVPVVDMVRGAVLATLRPILLSLNVHLGSTRVMNLCWSSSIAVGRSFGSRARHFVFKKSRAASSRCTSSGTGGRIRLNNYRNVLAWSPLHVGRGNMGLTCIMAGICSSSPHGRLPDHISMTTQPRLQISTLPE